MAETVSKVSQAFSADYLKRMAQFARLEGASFWWCPECQKPSIVFSNLNVNMCRAFSHKPLRMVKLKMDVDLE